MEKSALVEKILSKTIEFIDNDLFEPVEAEDNIFKDEIFVPDVKWYLTYLNSMDNVPIDVALVTHTNTFFTKEQEQIIFLRFNYAKKRLVQLIKKAKQHLNKKLSESIVYWYECATSNRNYVASVNLALVIKMCYKIKGYYDAEFIAVGNLSLLYAIRKFDINRNCRFATFTWYVIYNDMLKESIKQTLYRKQHKTFYSGSDREPNICHDIEYNDDQENYDNIDLIRYILNNKIAKLTPRENDIIQLRFFITREDNKKFTLKQIAQKLDISCNCIQRSEQIALKKIKRAWLSCDK